MSSKIDSQSTKPQRKRELEYEFFKTISGMVTAAFGLVAALAWNEAVKGMIDRYVKVGDGLRSKLYYAFIVTILAVLVTYYFGKVMARLSDSRKNHD